jgi:D-gamma-glutamyl-meso-diaminopimelic acid endopeptidase CwlS
VLLIPIKKPLYNIHVVEMGDSLWNIARKYNTTVDELKRLNGLSSDMIILGQQIKLPL